MLNDRAALMKQHAFETFERVQGVLHRFELTYNITTRWTPDMEEWKAASHYSSMRAYQKALSKLEGLVIARLFELHKMGLSGTGMFCQSITHAYSVSDVNAFRVQTTSAY
jgi:hypothetical protein